LWNLGSGERPLPSASPFTIHNPDKPEPEMIAQMKEKSA
jgi:hypothetical protein